LILFGVTLLFSTILYIINSAWTDSVLYAAVFSLFLAFVNVMKYILFTA